MINDESVTIRYSVNPYHSGYSPSLFLQERKVHHNTLEHRHVAFSGSSDVKPQKHMAAIKGCVRCISSLNFSKEKAYLKL